MDFSVMDLDEDVLAFWAEVRSFFDAQIASAAVHPFWRPDEEHDWEFSRALASRGWQAPSWPREIGGGGLDPLRARIVALEIWRRGIPDLSRVTSIQIAEAMMPWIDDELRAEIYPAIAAGEMLLCQGITEPESGSDAAAATTRATRLENGDGWSISGQKMFTTNAQNCAYCFLLTRTDTTVAKHAGLTVFLVPLDSAGIHIGPVYTMGDERTNMVTYEQVVVSDRYRIGPVNSGWQVLNSQLDAEHGLHEEDVVTAGFASRTALQIMLDRLLEWAGELDAAGDRPLDRPEVQAGLADIAIELAVASATPEPFLRVVASEALRRSVDRALTLIGPDGLIRHGAPGAVVDGLVERVYRTAPATAIYGGTTEVFRNLVAERMLDLPRQRPTTPRPASTPSA